jgi:hypothetical protein
LPVVSVICTVYFIMRTPRTIIRGPKINRMFFVLVVHINCVSVSN